MYITLLFAQSTILPAYHHSHAQFLVEVTIISRATTTDEIASSVCFKLVVYKLCVR